MTEQLIANDLKDVLHRAKDMGCKKVKAFYDIPLENVETVIKALEEIQKYRVLGTVEELREAREKQMPKKVEIKDWNPARCPSCGMELSESIVDGYYRHPTFLEVCPNPDCCQRLDWSE